MAELAGQYGARRLRNGMMPLRPDWSTTWHMYVLNHTSHTIFWSCVDTFLFFSNSQMLFFYACGRFARWKPVLPDLQLRWLANSFIKQTVNWHHDTGVSMETDGTIASPWSGLHFLALSGGACVSASGIWVRWWTIFTQIFARNPFIHLGIKRVSS